MRCVLPAFLLCVVSIGGAGGFACFAQPLPDRPLHDKVMLGGDRGDGRLVFEPDEHHGACDDEVLESIPVPVTSGSTEYHSNRVPTAAVAQMQKQTWIQLEADTASKKVMLQSVLWRGMSRGACRLFVTSHPDVSLPAAAAEEAKRKPMVAVLPGTGYSKLLTIRDQALGGYQEEVPQRYVDLVTKYLSAHARLKDRVTRFIGASASQRAWRLILYQNFRAGVRGGNHEFLVVGINDQPTSQKNLSS